MLHCIYLNLKSQIKIKIIYKANIEDILVHMDMMWVFM
jgi:hypothetical protein